MTHRIHEFVPNPHERGIVRTSRCSCGAVRLDDTPVLRIIEDMTGLEAVRAARHELAELRDGGAAGGTWTYDEGLDSRSTYASVLRSDGVPVVTGIIDGTGRLITGMHAMLGPIDSWWAEAERSLAEVEQSGSNALAQIMNMTGGGRHGDAIDAARRFLRAVTS